MSTKYRMRKLSVAIKKSGAHFFMGVCGAYNNVHKLSIHFIALSVNLVPLFHHLPHIYSPFAIHTNSHSSFNPFFGPDLQLVLSRAFFFLSPLSDLNWNSLPPLSTYILHICKNSNAFASVSKCWRYGVTGWWWKCKCADTIIPI